MVINDTTMSYKLVGKLSQNYANLVQRPKEIKYQKSLHVFLNFLMSLKLNIYTKN